MNRKKLIQLGKDVAIVALWIVIFLALFIPQSVAFWSPEGFYN